MLAQPAEHAAVTPRGGIAEPLRQDDVPPFVEVALPFGGDDLGHGVLGLLVARPSTQRQVFAMGEDDQLFAEIGGDELRRHGRFPSAINIAPVAGGNP